MKKTLNSNVTPITKARQDALDAGVLRKTHAIRWNVERARKLEAAVPLRYISYSMDIPVDLDAVPIEGRVRVYYDGGWGSEYITHEHTPLVNPSWRTLLLECEKAIVESGDRHHIFLEKLVPRNFVQRPGSDPETTIEVVTGS